MCPAFSAEISSLSEGFRRDDGARPDIVFVILGDWGYGDLACYGRQDVRTPTSDQLASDVAECSFDFEADVRSVR